MAEVKQRQATSRPVFGKETLQRMLQLEKQSQHRRLANTSTLGSSTETSSPHQEPTKDGQRFTSPPAQIAQKSQQVQSPPTSAQRTTSQPAAPVSIPPPQPAKEHTSPANPEVAIDSGESSANEICGSPSWSDFGGSKKKKEKKRLEKVQKELDKKLKKVEKERQAAIKAGKRLSKRPPAAMETQRMPAALRNTPVPQANPATMSQERPSISSRRSSTGSQVATSRIGSATSSTLPSSNKPPPLQQSRQEMASAVVSQSPTQSCMAGGRSRSGSNGTQNSAFAESDEQYMRNLVNFAAATNIDPQPVSPRNTRRVSFSIETTRPSPPPRSITMSIVESNSLTNTMTSKIEQQEIAMRTRRASSSSVCSASFRGKQDGKEGGYQYPRFTRSQSIDTTKEPATDLSQFRSEVERTRQLDTAEQPRTSINTFKPHSSTQSSDGGSYVQKHRMHQQQRSIAGFEDELALEGANGLSRPWGASDIEKQRWPPTPKGSLESLDHKENEEVADNDGQANSEDSSDEEEWDQYHAYLSAHSRTATTLVQEPSSSPSRAEKLLGFTRRPKLGSPSTSTASTNTITQRSSPRGSPYRSESPSSPVSQDTVALVSRISKAERTLGETIAQPLIPPPKSANRNSRPVTANRDSEIARDSLEPSKSPNAAGNRPKSRHISSQLLIRTSATSKALPELPKSFATHQSPKAEEPSAFLLATANEARNSPKGSNVSPPISATSSADSVVTPEPQTNTSVPQVVVEGIDGDGSTRRASIKRPRSNPQLQGTSASQDLSFLPELKHQALVKKPNRNSPPSSLASSRSSFGTPPSEKSSSNSPPQFPAPSPPSTRPSSDDGCSLPVGASSLNYTPKAGLRPPSYAAPGSLLRPGTGSRRNTTSPSSGVFGAGAGSAAAAANQIKPLAKMFVICCQCKFWHDLPSRLYEAMATPRHILADDQATQNMDAGTGEAKKESENSGEGEDDKKRRKSRVQGRVDTRVQCPWCEHGMSTACCAGWTTVVYLHERHH